MYINNSGTWKKITSMFINTAGTWKKITDGYINVAGTWKRFFSSLLTPVIEQQVTISKSGNYYNTSTPITLTGRKYHFANANTYSYRFYRSSDQVTWTAITAATSTTNPASGSFQDVTYSLQLSDFPSSTMYFRFEYTAVNTTFNTTATSTSTAVSVNYLEIPAPPSGYPRITQSTISVSSNGESGTWSGSPTSYQWYWYYNDGTDKVLTYQASKSISNKAIVGSVATLTSTGHGFKESDQVAISGVDNLFNVASVGIFSVSSNSFSYVISKPTWSFTTNYLVDDYVFYNSNIYRAIQSTPTFRPDWAFATNYTVGSYVNYNSTVYQSIISTPTRTTWTSGVGYSVNQYVNYGSQLWRCILSNNSQPPFNGSPYWELIDIYPGGNYWTAINIYPGGSYWQLQNFSTSASGTATGPNYYEGLSSSPVTQTISSFPSSDYKTGTLLKTLLTKFYALVSNVAFSASAVSTARTIYGYPSISLGTETLTGTTASIPYTQSDMSVYDIDVITGASSVTGYPKVNQANSSPISITGLTAGTTYTVYVTPKNADSPRISGIQRTKTFTTPSPPGTPTITFSSITASGFTVSWSASGATSYNVDIKNASSGLSIGIYPVSGITSTSAVVSGLLNATQYTVYVTGVNSSGNGPQATASQYTNAILSYSGNSNTGGTAPSSSEHTYASSATVSGNTGSLTRTYGTWAGWSLATDGSGTTYGPGYTTTILMNQSRTLYARWLANIPGTPSVTVSRGPTNATASTNYLVFNPVNFGTDTQSVLLEWGTTTAYSSGSSSVSTNGGSYTTPANLSANTTYYWRARGYNPLYSGYGTAQTGSIFIPQAQIAPFNGSATISLLSGTAGRMGATYYVSAASASGTPTPSISGYQWQYFSLASSSWFNITNETSSSYTLKYNENSGTIAMAGRDIRCLVTFSNGVSPNLNTGSNSVSISNPTITGVTATLSLTSPYIVYRVYGYNFQSIESKNSYGLTTPPGTTDANYTYSQAANSTIPITRQSGNGGDTYYYRLEVAPYDKIGTGSAPTSPFSKGTTIFTTTVRNTSANRTNSPINVYGTGSA
jgi:hypothetical protein